MRILLLLVFTFFSPQLFAQVVSGIPDSATNINFPGSTGQYTVTNPLLVSGSTFSNPPIAMACFSNCKSDYLYFHDFDFNVPLTANILGIEVIHNRGGCNAGSYVIDTLYLANQGGIISNVKRDSTASGIDTLGSSTDTWGAGLTPGMINTSDFGIYLQTTGTGICTFGQFMIEMKVHYSIGSSLPDIHQMNQNEIKVFAKNESEEIQIHKGNLGVCKFTIFDMQGRRVYTGELANSVITVFPFKASKGIYILRTHGKENQVVRFTN